MRLRYAWRIWPATMVAVPTTLGVAWTIGSGLDTPFERTVLIAVATVGLAATFVDPAASITASSPTSLRQRLVAPGTIAFLVGFSGWLVPRWAAAVGARVAAPDGAELVEWAVIALSQLAVGVMVARRRQTVSIGPGVVTAVVWLLPAGLPTLGRHLYVVSDHLVVWAGLAVAAVVVAGAASVDPARR